MSLVTLRYFWCVVIFFLLGDVNYKPAMASVLEVPPALFPYHAIVSGKYLCAGTLISEDYVVCPAHCVYNTTWGVNVFLGFSSSSYAFLNYYLDVSLLEDSTEVVHSHNVTVHEQFTRISKNVYLNNIALIKFPYKVSLRKTIQPAILMSQEEYYGIIISSDTVQVDVTGWSQQMSSNLSITSALKVNQDVCTFLYGSNNFFKGQEVCLEWSNNGSHPNLPGNPIRLNGKILGFIVSSECLLLENSSSRCNAKILSIPPFIDWVAKVTNIDVLKLTGPKKEKFDFSKKVDSLLEMTEDVKLQNIKYRAGLERLEGKSMEIRNVLNEVKNGIRNSCSGWNE